MSEREVHEEPASLNVDFDLTKRLAKLVEASFELAVGTGTKQLVQRS